MKPIGYLFQQMELEGIKRVSNDLITRVSPSTDEFPLVLLACTSDKISLIYFDDSLPIELRDQIPSNNLKAFKTESVSQVFKKYGINVTINSFKTYIFPDRFATADIGDVKCFRQDDPKITAFGFNGLADKNFAVEQDGVIVSACVSSRQNSACAEAWVFTHPDHRRKGLAQRVVTAWAANLLSEGIIPFYSHTVENRNSGLLAKKLNLLHQFDETVIEEAP
jgi:hypothetical protein